jgi:hypothetical protein
MLLLFIIDGWKDAILRWFWRLAEMVMLLHLCLGFDSTYRRFARYLGAANRESYDDAEE